MSVATRLRRWLGDVPATDSASVPTITSIALTHVGHTRSINEDRVLDRRDRGLWAVADGMGGHSAGDVAAQIAVDALATLADGTAEITTDSVRATLAGANRAIRTCDAGTGICGTTIVALHIDGARATIFWVGDSRAYHVRGGSVVQVTTDHSWVQEMVDAGALTPGEADRHPKANVITRALGVADDCDIDIRTIALAVGDLVLLCSDGLSRKLQPSDLIAEPLASLGSVANRLMGEALLLDGSDNVSLVMVRFG